MLGCLARVTRRARLGTSVLVIPYRHPLVTAKILATIDQLSGGRVILGAGVGWLREEFEALGAPPFEERGPVTDEYLRFMRAHVDDGPRQLLRPLRQREQRPRAAQARAARRHSRVDRWPHRCGAFRRAATLGDGWHPIALRPPGLLLPRRVRRAGAADRGVGARGRSRSERHHADACACPWRCVPSASSRRPASARSSRAPPTR